MRLTFRRGSLIHIFEIDRQNKKLKVASPLTKMEMKELEWNMLFDKGKEKEEEIFSDNLSDTEFINWLRIGMLQHAHILVGIE